MTYSAIAQVVPPIELAMRIVIDLQGAQAANRNRGIGRYSLSLVKAMIAARGDHEIILALNGALLESALDLQREFRKISSSRCVRTWQPPASVEGEGSATMGQPGTEKLYEAFMASLSPDCLLITSFFEGCGDNAVTSVGNFIPDIPVAVVHYDLIPLLYPQFYLTNPRQKQWYMRKVELLQRADLLLAISESSRDDAVSRLGTKPSSVVNISAAVDEHFVPRAVSLSRSCTLRTRYSIGERFILYTGGMDVRKNIERLLQAYASLDAGLLAQHQLVVVCAVSEVEESRLQQLAANFGIESDRIIFCGYVPENDLVDIYNLCHVFVFPSWYEGFGLPVLEAMRCGRAVIAGNTSSLPEIVGREDALFDPLSVPSIAEMLTKVLTRDVFRKELEKHSLARAAEFSWERTARLAIAAMERLAGHPKTQDQSVIGDSSRPRLAYCSPLPPDKSGITDYSRDLLPALARHYVIDIIADAHHEPDTWMQANCGIQSLSWFLENGRSYDRVLYHFGNSGYHEYMFDALIRVPGIVMLHDFFLSGAYAHMTRLPAQRNRFTEVLYHSHGYQAVVQQPAEGDIRDTVWKYPCNAEIIDVALGVLVHSRYSCELAETWYGEGVSEKWGLIPFCRVPVSDSEEARENARRELDVSPETFLVCSFGFMGESKLNHRLLEAWLRSPLSDDRCCALVFVGHEPEAAYLERLRELSAGHAGAARIRITGWVDRDQYKRYLLAADLAVQLRTLSRGETSAAVFDCLNQGIPAIVNAHGSMSELPAATVWMLQDNFTTESLMEALEILRNDPAARRHLRQAGRDYIHENHCPQRCAKHYRRHIEAAYRDAERGVPGLVSAIRQQDAPALEPDSARRLATAIDRSVAPPMVLRQLLVDISELHVTDASTGIQRVVKSLLRELLVSPPRGLRVEPVYATCSSDGYRYARRFTAGFLGRSAVSWTDDPVSFRAGDVFLGLDLSVHIVRAQQDYFRLLRAFGVDVRFVVYDLLCVEKPEFFVEGAGVDFTAWLEVISESNGVICISKTVAEAFAHWQAARAPDPAVHDIEIDSFCLGADFRQRVGETESSALPPLPALRNISGTVFLMVGTLEPRKGHVDVLDAFDQLWKERSDVNLVIAGRQGWLVEKLVTRLKSHPQLKRRLFWLSEVSDAELDTLYQQADCLVAASYGEGLGLPLIEAARSGLPVLARDIPVFREAVGDYARYFSGSDPGSLKKSLGKFTGIEKENKGWGVPQSSWPTWQESAAELRQLLEAAL